MAYEMADRNSGSIRGNGFPLLTLKIIMTLELTDPSSLTAPTADIIGNCKYPSTEIRCRLQECRAVCCSSLVWQYVSLARNRFYGKLLADVINNVNAFMEKLICLNSWMGSGDLMFCDREGHTTVRRYKKFVRAVNHTWRFMTFSSIYENVKVS
jgi:hypothetical protein